ncbi:hypothetical protein LTR37_005995 [Vermiconidia calcicola]|uniref:Uncharacterized protein n=1 Tax=Vermiconidia calcicola TaxID=1690605 RepID=A0ACC3NI81_9PEZI|nr:hypothetical protein LTR37_005995 [Vermiconidia calcicola]
MYPPKFLLLIAAVYLEQVSGWGTLGHETIASIAQNLVKDQTEAWAQYILNDTSSSYLANVSTWADSYRYTAEGEFSAPFHYIDAEDDPPTSCNVDFDRDCGDEGCSVSAIANYTQRVQQSDSLDVAEVSNALKFLVHLLGDITQPLHDEAYKIGGNDVNVTFDGEDRNLHSVWDTEMPEQLRGGDSLTDAEDWAANLTAEINNGTFAAMKKSWLEGLDVDDAQGTALLWAQDANRYVCSTVMPDGQSPLTSEDLYPDYYDSAIDTVELQVAKAGYRLAAWLDAIAQKHNSITVGAGRRSRNREVGTVADEQDQSAKKLLPQPNGPKSLARQRREAFGWGCRHQH